MDLMRTVERTSQAECREMGEILIAMSEMPRDATWHANIEAAMAPYRDPGEQSIKEVLNKARDRLYAMNDGFLRDGTNHAKLLEEELKRRGGKRSVEEYCRDVADGSTFSDVIHGD